jgi:hypothetical protein
MSTQFAAHARRNNLAVIPGLAKREPGIQEFKRSEFTQSPGFRVLPPAAPE